MADATLQTVEGAGVLSALANLFFKGMDKALSERAEYEEEMGVLKQVNRIPIESLDGTETYTLTVKLSPVRGRGNLYFVEAETDAPGLNVDKINNKTMKIDNSNIAQFRNLIDKLVESSNFAARMSRSDESQPEAEVVGEPAEGEKNASEEGEVTAEGQVADLIEAAEDWFADKAIIASTSDDKLVELHPSFTDNITSDACELEITMTDESGRGLDYSELSDSTINLRDANGNIIDRQSFLQAVKDKINEFARANRLNNVQHAIRNSTQVSATFIKDAEGIGLTAVKAADDLEKSMEIIYNVMDSDEFAETLKDDEELSFNIEETEEDYDIEPVDTIDCTQCYADVYKAVSKFYMTLKLLESMIGTKIWNSDNYFSDLTGAVVALQTKVSIWALDKADMLPVLQDPFSLVPTFEKFRGYNDNSQIPEIKENTAELADRTTRLCLFLAVSFDAESYSELEACCTEIDKIVTENK